MSDFIPQSLCLLGRQPRLGLAELESLYGADHVRPFGQHALLDIPAEEINFKRLGGTIKVARVINTKVGKTWREVERYLLKNSPGHIARMPEGAKITVGISAYGVLATPAQIGATGLKVKRLIRASGRPARIVPNKEPNLSSAQVLHNKLTNRGGWELVFAGDGRQIILAQTLFVQDIEAYAARDQARPARDARVGMLPPKLAQIIINLAIGEAGTKNSDAKTSRYTVLDPFCGTGVVLQEALLMGYRAMGTDIDPKMVDFAQKNLKWLYKNHPQIIGTTSVEPADATNYQWPIFSVLASEAYLGRPLGALPPPAKLKEIINDTNTVIRKFLLNLQPQLRANNRVCLALPAWLHNSGQTTHLPLIDQIGKLGYNRLEFKHVRSSDLVYFRPGQTVARQLLVLVKN